MFGLKVCQFLPSPQDVLIYLHAKDEFPSQGLFSDQEGHGNSQLLDL